MTDFKTFIWVVLSGVMAFLHPIGNFMVAMVIVFALNYLAGLTADVVSGNSWSMKKSMSFIYHCCVFFVIAAALFTIGHFMKNESGAVQCVSVICYAAIYLYAVNILRNIRTTLDTKSTMYKLIDYLYYVLSLQVIERVPFMKNYKQKEDENKRDDTEQDKGV